MTRHLTARVVQTFTKLSRANIKPVVQESRSRAAFSANISKEIILLLRLLHKYYQTPVTSFSFIKESVPAFELRSSVTNMKLQITLLSLLALVALSAASPLASSSNEVSNLTFEEKHGCPSQGCPHNSASSIIGSGGLGTIYAAILMSFAALL